MGIRLPGAAFWLKMPLPLRGAGLAPAVGVVGVGLLGAPNEDGLAKENGMALPTPADDGDVGVKGFGPGTVLGEKGAADVANARGEGVEAGAGEKGASTGVRGVVEPIDFEEATFVKEGDVDLRTEDGCCCLNLADVNWTCWVVGGGRYEGIVGEGAVSITGAST